MRKLFKRLKSRESGQAAVEFALTLPLVLLLICGVLEMGWVASNVLLLRNAAREGVRAGIVATDSASNTALVKERIESMTPAYIDEPLDVTVTYSDPDNFRAGDITVVVNYQLDTLTPLTGIFATDGSFDLTAKCTMKMS